MNKNEKHRGVICMIIASFLFAASGSFVKYLTLRLPSMEVVFFRFAISIAVLIPWMIHRDIPLSGKNRPVLLFRSLCGFIAGSLAFYVTSKIALADAYLLTYSSPVFVAILSAIFFKEYVPPRLYALIFVATIGCAFVLRPSFDFVSIPGILGIVSAIFSALAYLGIKKLHKTDASTTIVLHFSLFSAIAALLIFGQSFIYPTPRESLALLGCGLCATLGQVLMTFAYKFQEASQVSPYSYATVFFSAFFGVLFWNEIPGWGTLVGGSLIVIAGVGILKIRDTQTKIAEAPLTSIGKAAYE